MDNNNPEMEMTPSNLDRWIAFWFSVMIFALCGIGVLMGHGDRVPWVIGFYVVLFIASFNYNSTGWWAQYKLFGDLIEYYVDSGPYFTFPMVFGSLKQDCRDQIFKQDHVRVMTRDLAEVEIKEVSLVWAITHLGRYHNLKPAELPALLDDVVDKTIKRKVRHSQLKEVATMELGTEQIEASNDLANWGMTARKILVPEVPRPTNDKVSAALQARVSEALEQEADAVEIDNVIREVAKLMKEGWTREQAIDRVDLTTKGATKTVNVRKIMADSAALTALDALVGSSKE